MNDFGRWEDLHFPGNLVGGQTIAACSWGHHELDIFAIASGAIGNTLTLELWHKYYDHTGEYPWMHIDRGMYGICAVSPHQGRLDLFGVYIRITNYGTNGTSLMETGGVAHGLNGSPLGKVWLFLDPACLSMA